MADTIVEFLAGTAQTLTLKLFPLGSESIANGAGGDSCAEATERKRLYLATVAESLAGIYHAHVFDVNGSCILAGYVLLADDTNTYRLVTNYDKLLEDMSELAQGIPPATPNPLEALMYLYMALRNKIDVTLSAKEFHNDAGAVVWKKVLSDDDTTYSEAKGASGP